MRTNAALVVLVLLASGSASATAAPRGHELGLEGLPADVRAGLPDDARPRVEEVTSTIAALRRAFHQGSLRSGVELAYSIVEPGAASTPSRVSPRPPAGDLIAAVTDALRTLGPVPRTELGQALRPLGRAAQVRGPSPRATAWTSPARTAPAPPAIVPQQSETGSSSIRAASLEILQAIDRVLAATPAPQAPSDAAVPGCDVRDLLPVLCIGGSSDNLYTADAALLIDLGGNDEYRNGAGGAPFLLPGQPVAVPVSVNLDLGAGSDRYVPEVYIETGSGSSRIRTVLAHGAAATNSLGILVDQGGDDLYSVAAPPTGDGVTGTVAIAGGASVATGQPGLGALFDLAGSDHYEVFGPEDPGPATTLTAQGASLSGVGLLVDRGVEADAFEIDARTLIVPQDTGGSRSRIARGQGFTRGTGAGILIAEGGSDAFRMFAGIRRRGPLRYPEGDPMAAVAGQGAGTGGPGMLLTGQGDTTYELLALNDGMGWNRVEGQGMALAIGGIGVLDDLGGHDRYTAEAIQTYDLDLEIDDSCTTVVDGAEVRCEHAEVEVDGYRFFLTSEVFAQGTGWSGTLGMLRDRAGNDTYEGSAEAHLDVSLHDALTAPSRPPAVYVRGFDTPLSWVQGAGGGNAAPGLLVDQAGTDRYTARSLNQTRVDASSDHAAGEPETIAFSWMDGAWVIHQGASLTVPATFGGLYDLGGDGDVFHTEGLVRNETRPDPDGAFSYGTSWAHQHGYASGSLTALGDDPVIRSIPSNPTCQDSGGVRGHGMWRDCRTTVPGAGAAPNASGSTPTLHLTEDTPAEAALDSGKAFTRTAPRIPVGVRVTAADGSPVAGDPVDLWLQHRCTTADPWRGNWRISSVTDDEGVARVLMPLLFTGDLVETNPACRFDWRLLIAYAGAPGIRPQHLIAPLRLTSG